MKGELEVRLEGIVLERVRSFKYLGVWVQEDGKWGEMIEHSCKKGKRRLAFLAGQWEGNKKWTVDERRRIWEFVGRPEVEYGSEVWGEEGGRELGKLERVEMEAGRKILGVGGAAPNCFVTGGLGWEGVVENGWEKMARFVGKLEMMEEGRTVKKVYIKMKLAWGKEKKGGLWIRKIAEVMRRWNLKREWEEGIGEVEKGIWDRRVKERKQTWVEAR